MLGSKIGCIFLVFRKASILGAEISPNYWLATVCSVGRRILMGAVFSVES